MKIVNITNRKTNKPEVNLDDINIAKVLFNHFYLLFLMES